VVVSKLKKPGIRDGCAGFIFLQAKEEISPSFSKPVLSLPKEGGREGF
jgi:hypothetical protein